VLTTTVSIGIARYPTDGEDMETLFKNADAAMYLSKDAGRNTYKLYGVDNNP
jgi:diguanylate cyclase (GGDEF)-like protein